MTDTDRPERWAALIESKRTAKRPKLSARRAAEMADLSEGRWRQIIKGYQAAGGGNRIPVAGPPETVARMAAAVGVTPDELEEAGNAAAAEVMRKAEAAWPEVQTDLHGTVVQGREADEVREWLDTWLSGGWSGPPPDALLRLFTTDRLMARVAAALEERTQGFREKVAQVERQRERIRELEERLNAAASGRGLSAVPDTTEVAEAADVAETSLSRRQEESDLP